MPKFCGVCQTQNDDRAKFCINCGCPFQQNTNGFNGAVNNSNGNNYNNNNQGYFNPNNAFNGNNLYGNNQFVTPNYMNNFQPVKRTKKSVIAVICIATAIILLLGFAFPIYVAYDEYHLSDSEKSQFFSDGIAQADKEPDYNNWYIGIDETVDLTNGAEHSSRLKCFSYDESIVTVTDSGTATGVSKGTTYILWYYSDDDYGVLKITVDAVSGNLFNGYNGYGGDGKTYTS